MGQNLCRYLSNLRLRPKIDSIAAKQGPAWRENRIPDMTGIQSHPEEHGFSHYS